VVLTEIAHDKDINSVCISPNDKLIATGSQDKTAKVCCILTVANSMEQSPS
jgi:U3 small nucleolar RNA-associated protein 13